ncbi:MAG: hypothetical protein KDD36_05680 [Flavobacteriales bacterium]|nr:hypothetical protein [Flavobacteriales bacterium]
MKVFKNRELSFLAIFGLGLAMATMTGCDGGTKDTPEEEILEDDTDSMQSSMFKIGNSVFSIPSPFQTALLINKVEATYKKDILNSTANLPSYSTRFKKALNLGIYGADLGYITVYDVPQDAISYLNSVKKLADELGVSSAFDENTIKRFESNIGNRDSLLSLISVAYRASDTYLKNNEQNDVGALILAGGWIEGLYFSTLIAKTNPHSELLNRIGEQKHSLENLIALLRDYNASSEYDALLKELVELAYDFDAVEMHYTYEKPTVDRDKKVTHIRSKSEAIVSQELLAKIGERIEKLRGQITG